MPAQKFVNREKEIDQIGQLIKAWGTRKVVCIEGEGGVGKTRLLDHIRELYPPGLQASFNLLVTKRIDFDDPALHASEILGSRIAEELGERTFTPYFEALLDWHKMGEAGVSRERIEEEGKRVNQTFVSCFNEITRHWRVVLLMDTLEQMATPSLMYRLEFVGHLSNVLIILAGREMKPVYEEIAARIGEEDTVFLRLEPLPDVQVEEYIQFRQRELRLALGDDLIKRLVALARGKPLLADLALEWVAREVSLPSWLWEKPLEELKETAPALQAKFEKDLLSPISALRTPRDRLLWMMSMVSPMDKEMVRRLSFWKPEKVDAVWKEVEALSFVRRLPDGRLMLHDVVREMILRHLRADIEPEREEQWFSEMLGYLDELHGEIRAQIKELEEKENRARREHKEEEAREYILERVALERTLWAIEGQIVGYALLRDPKAGLKKFEKAWERATKRYNLSQREVLLAQVERASDRWWLSGSQINRIRLRKAQYFLDHAMYREAEQLLKRILAESQEEPSLQAEALIQKGNVMVRLGRFKEGVKHFVEAVEMSHRHNLQNVLVRALNAAGWGYRLTGKIDEAAQYYREALELSLSLGDKVRQAWLLNNLGFVYALQHKRAQALSLCQESIRLWKELEIPRGLGAAYNTLGEVLLEFNQFEEAVPYFDKALDIFSAEDAEWLSKAHSGRGAAFWLMGRLEEAKKDLEEALHFNLKSERPSVTHRLAHVYLDLGEVDEAKRWFEESYKASRSAPEPFYELNSLGDLARIAIMEGNLGVREEYERKWEDFRKRHPEARYLLPEGLLLRYFGDLRLLAGAYKQAEACYQKAFPLIAQAGSYEPYTLPGQLADMESLVLRQVNPKIRRKLAGSLKKWWKEEKLEEEHPEALPYFVRWERENLT